MRWLLDRYALVLAVLVDAPALHAALVAHTLSPDAALVRLLVALPVSAAAVALLRAWLGPYVTVGRAHQRPAAPVDPAAEPAAEPGVEPERRTPAR
ncbi:MAG: hypothetical protein ACYCXA_13650 [Actinomycetes bacterium]